MDPPCCEWVDFGVLISLGVDLPLSLGAVQVGKLASVVLGDKSLMCAARSAVQVGTFASPVVGDKSLRRWKQCFM